MLEVNKELFEDYKYTLEMYAEEGNKRSNTTKAYVGDIEQFLNYLEVDARIIKLQNANEWLKSLSGIDGNKIATSTRNRKIVSLKQFYDYLVKTGTIQNNPLVMLKPTTIKKGENGNQITRDFLEKTEINKLLKVLDKEANNPTVKRGNSADKARINALRDKAIYNLMINSGMRVGEIISLEWCQIQEYDDYVDIYIPTEKSKNKESRYIPVSLDIIDMIKRYNKNNSSEWVFLSQNGKQLTHKSIEDRLKMYIEMAKIDKNITCHSLRHTYATHMSNRSDINSKVLASYMGHKSTKMIEEVYYHKTDEMKRKVFKI